MVEEEQRRFPGNGPRLLEQKDLVTLSHVAAVWVNPFVLWHLELKDFSAAASLLLWQ